MKILKIFSVLSLVFLSLIITSCLDSDNEYNGQTTATDFVTIASYSGQNVAFTLTNQNGEEITLVSNQSEKIDHAKYPVGSRAFITYSYQEGQDITKSIQIDLMSINSVSSIPVTPVLEVPDFNYGRLTTSRIYYLAGYVNMILSVQKSTSRTWECYLDTRNSTGEVAELYLATKAIDETPDTYEIAVSVNISSMLGANRYKTIRIHINDQNGTDNVYQLSVLNSNTEDTPQATGQDFVTVASYSPQNITFSLTNQNGGIISLYSNQAAKVDETQYPVGSRAFITYSYQIGQDVSKAVKIDLMSINPVTTFPITTVTEVPGISYGRISTSRIYYLAGYVNMILSVQKSNNRTWKCYFDSASSTGDVAELYLDTKATDETPDLIGVALSVDVSSITSGNRFKTIRFHINDQNGEDHIYLLHF